MLLVKFFNWENMETENSHIHIHANVNNMHKMIKFTSNQKT